MEDMKEEQEYEEQTITTDQLYKLRKELTEYRKLIPHEKAMLRHDIRIRAETIDRLLKKRGVTSFTNSVIHSKHRLELTEEARELEEKHDKENPEG
ncbi:MAG: hypothetical protein GY861_17245 [bacterium]|nr:hypothetical protein [bacterium]